MRIKINVIVLNSDTRDGTLSSAEKERALPCPDVALSISAAKPCDGKTGS